MTKCFTNFERIASLINPGNHGEPLYFLINQKTNVGEETIENHVFSELNKFLRAIFNEIDEIAAELKNDNTILISVKNQKLLRTCFQLITSLGILPSLIPGLGISLSKRCLSAHVLPSFDLSDEQKYQLLTECTDFFTRCYSVPVIKNIIVTLHLCDYLACLIQLSFAPLKKPGTYNNFVMSQELYERLNKERQGYVKIYENLVANCFQPFLMKELLVLQSVTNPNPPTFVKRVIAKEMSQRLLAPGGLLSLIRCFIESYGVDTGFEWKKIDLICKIVSAKHGNKSDEEYLSNICSQLKSILLTNNTHYLSTAVACVLSLNEQYNKSDSVQNLVKAIFQTLDYEELISKPYLPGTILLSPLEVERTINVLNACVCTTKLDCPVSLLLPNLYILYLLGIKCSKNEEIKIKIKDILLKLLETVRKEDISATLTMLLFGKMETDRITVEEYEAGLAIKFAANTIEYPKKDSLLYFINLFKASPNLRFIQTVFEVSLQKLVELSEKRNTKKNTANLLSFEDPLLLDDNDEQYIDILQLLSEICTYPKIISSLKESPAGVMSFIEYFLLKNFKNSNEECVTIALVLLNTILESSDKDSNLENKFENIVPILKQMANDDLHMNNILCKEALSLITNNKPQQPETRCAKAISDVFNSLLPIRAHGIIELTKLINSKDPETISKKHLIFCLFQEQLNDSDSYIYLAAINGIAALGSYCTDDVLHILCKEFLNTTKESNASSKEDYNKCTELRMKIGDVLVKVTRQLGEMAVLHKNILLNTILCGCRDDDPLIRTSALSNLAEIALILHYRVGTIIYEILLCVWGIIETDKAVECRRAAVMVISSLLKGLGKETLIQLKDNLLPIYRTLKELYRNPDEDEKVRLHAQIALEELNDTVKDFLFPELSMEKELYVLDKPANVFQ